MSNMPESYTPPIPEHESVIKYTNYAANNELVNMLGGLLLEDPDRTFTATELAHTFSISGVSERFSRGDMIRYCRERLEPAGVAIRQKVTGYGKKEIDAWQADPEFLQTKRALAGLVSSWSLDHPDLSVQQLFDGNRKKCQSQQPRAERTIDMPQPQIRHIIYKALLSSDKGLPLTGLTAAVAGDAYTLADWQFVRASVQKIAAFGILDKTVIPRNKYNPIFKITGTVSEHSFPKRAETQVLYKVLGRLGLGTIVTAQELVAEAQREDSSICPTELHALLIQKTSDSALLPSLILIDNPKPTDPGGYTVSLSSSAKQPIAELVEGIAAIANPDNRDTVDHYGKLNETIMRSQPARIKLYEKARQFSSRAGYEGKAVRLQAIEKILSESGPADAQTIHSTLIDQGALIVLDNIHKLLSQLATTNKVTVEKQPLQPGSRLYRNIYALASPPSPDTSQ